MAARDLGKHVLHRGHARPVVLRLRDVQRFLRRGLRGLHLPLPRARQRQVAQHQIAKLDAREKERVQKAIGMVGSVLVGRVVTRGLVLRFAKLLGMRLTTAQAAKYVPIAGQLVSGALGYAALQYLGEQHIRDCVRVALAAPLALPAPADAVTDAGEHPQHGEARAGADPATA